MSLKVRRNRSNHRWTSKLFRKNTEEETLLVDQIESWYSQKVTDDQRRCSSLQSTSERARVFQTIALRTKQSKTKRVRRVIQLRQRSNSPSFVFRFSEKDFFEQGPDVYAAARTVEYDGRFRIHGRHKWINKLEKPKGTLALNLNFQLEAVDLSQSAINIDGLDHYGRWDKHRYACRSMSSGFAIDSFQWAVAIFKRCIWLDVDSSMIGFSLDWLTNFKINCYFSISVVVRRLASLAS